MRKIVATTGNLAAAEAMRQINPEVCAAYPITPSTEVVQEFASFVADGLVDTELVTVESEHSAMSACIGAAAGGGRVMTATSSQGLGLMWEMLYIAAGLRLPMVLTCVNRALSSPINIHADHSDSMGARDSGWIQIYSENAQECYDNLIQAFPIAEKMDVRLPVMVCMDGFLISHSIERMEMFEDHEVQEFIGEYKPHQPLLDVDNPLTYGPLDLQDYYIEHKRQEAEAMKYAPDAILEEGRRFGEKFGRTYGFIEEYRMDDADLALMVIGSAAGTTRATVDILRKEGINAGLLKLRVFRPFPKDEIAASLSNVKVLAVMDRCDSFGARGGPLFHEVRSALYDLEEQPKVINFIYGLGGRDVGVDDFKGVYHHLIDILEGVKIEEQVSYLKVRE